MTWHWYVSRGNELFLDLDSQRAAWDALERIDRNSAAGLLPVKDRHMYPSGTPGHFHLIVRTFGAMQPMERALWELHLGSDIRRQQYVMMRIHRGITIGADFLLTPNIYGFRKPDDTCECEGKHKDKSVTDNCPVLHALLGEERSAVYFAMRESVRIPFGKVPLNALKNERKKRK